MDLVSVILPTYNERVAIIPHIDAVATELQRLQIPFEIIVADDASPDGTGAAVSRYAEHHPQHKIILVERTQDHGLGLSIADGIRHATGSIIVGMDADGNHDPGTLGAILNGLQHAQLVVASRFVKNGGMATWYRYYPTLVINYCFYLLGMPILDNTSGYYAIKKKDLVALDLKKIYYGYGDYHLRLVHYANKAKYKILEVSTIYKERLGGASKSQLLRMLWSYSKEIIRLRGG